MQETLVSIWCVTYNHEPYIRDAIEGFLAQITTFKYEIVIYDDASTDRTVDIIREYEHKYPNIIHGIYQMENQYSRHLNSMDWIWKIQYENCHGKYVAFCEGDDCWLSSYKLQLQVDYLEEHEECIMISHDAVQVDYSDGSIKALEPYKGNKDLTPEEVIIQPYGRLPTASLVCRKNALEINGFFTYLGIGDYPLHLYCLSKGKIHYFDQIMSVYRFMHPGSWSSEYYGEDREKTFIHHMELLDFIMEYNTYTKRIYENYIISKVHIYVFHLLHHVFAFKTEEERLNNYIATCDLYDKKTKNKYHSFCEELKKNFLQTSKTTVCNDEIRNYVVNKKRIVILGAGKYASILAKQMQYNNIYFDGFAVSDNQNIEMYKQKKPIWRLGELPFEKDSLGIIIGINPVIWHEIIDTLEKEQVKDYICPFLFRDKRIDGTLYR